MNKSWDKKNVKIIYKDNQIKCDKSAIEWKSNNNSKKGIEIICVPDKSYRILSFTEKYLIFKYLSDSTDFCQDYNKQLCFLKSFSESFIAGLVCNLIYCAYSLKEFLSGR